MSNKNYLGNESFTITLTDLWSIGLSRPSNPRSQQDRNV